MVQPFSVEIGIFAYRNNGTEVSQWVDHPEQGFIIGQWESSTNATLDMILGFSPSGYWAIPSLAVGNNSNLRVHEVRLGALSAPGKTSGMARFRQFRSWRDWQSDVFSPFYGP